MPQKRITSPDGGINKYLPKDSIPDNTWSDGNNIHFGKGFVEKVTGWQKWYPTSLGAPVMWLDNYYKYNGDYWLMACTTEKIFKYNNTTNIFDDITNTPFTGTISHNIFADCGNDWFIVTNGVDKIQYWDGTSAKMQDLPGLTDCEGGVTDVRAKCVVYVNNFLMLGGTTENGVDCPQRIRWSRLGDITNWKNDSQQLGEAGYADLTDGVDWIQRIVPFQNYIVIYKERSIQVLNYVGGSLIWDKRPAMDGIGLLAPKAVVDLGIEHIFIGPTNIYSFDLTGLKIIGNDIAKDFFKLLDPSKAFMTGSFFLEEVPEVWFPFVSINSANGYHDKSLVYCIDTQKWSIKDMNMTAYGFWYMNAGKTIDQYTQTIDSMDTEFDSNTKMVNAPVNILGDAAGYIYIEDGNSKDGAALPCFLESKLFDLGRPDIIKRLKRIQLMTSREGPYNLNISIGICSNVEEDITWYGLGNAPLLQNGNKPYQMNLDVTYPPWIDVDLSGRYFILRLGTDLADQPFKMTGLIINFDLRGEM